MSRSLAAESPSTRFYFEGSVTVLPEPAAGLLGLVALGVLSFLTTFQNRKRDAA